MKRYTLQDSHGNVVAGLRDVSLENALMQRLTIDDACKTITVGEVAKASLRGETLYLVRTF